MQRSVVRWMSNEVSEDNIASILFLEGSYLSPCLAHNLPLNMEETCSTEMSVDFQGKTRGRYVPEDLTTRRKHV
jgi:hypothetical protein